MKREEFYKELQDILLLDDQIVDNNTEIELDSMSNLLLIAFFDENFGMTVSQEKIKSVNKIQDIVDIVGEDKID